MPFTIQGVDDTAENRAYRLGGEDRDRGVSTRSGKKKVRGGVCTGSAVLIRAVKRGPPWGDRQRPEGGVGRAGG